ncbi:MAG: hypothetical protein R2861_05165 [Desulfobacterales bacterium]
MERIIMLQTMDNLWKDHLLSMDHLKRRHRSPELHMGSLDYL